MNTSNSIPKGRVALINQARVALTGAIAFGADAELQQNTAPRIAAEFHDVVGDPASPLVLGKQPRFAGQLVVVKKANAAKRAAIAAGREFCRLAINLLRPALGNEWNTAWKAAGFAQPSLALPRQPAVLLDALGSYFAMNPARENAQANVTAGEARARAAAIDAAILAAATAKAQRVVYKRERDAALKKLRKRLSGLRAELAQLLEPEDGRWYKFGFRRPADGRQPVPVAEITLTPAGPGTVLVAWPTSARAESYRVTWKLESAAENEPTTDGCLSADEQCALTALPSGETIVVAVSARNSAGETSAIEASIVVP
jgi:hypothetical protein